MRRVAIIGAGFAGVWAARALRRRPADVEVLLFDPKPAFDLRPMLPDVVGGRIPASAVRSDTAALARRWGVGLRRERVAGLDAERRLVRAEGGGETECDAVIVAAGSEANFYGNEGAARHAFKLDDSRDAEVLAAAAARRRGACVVAGGGYTGVELATNLWRARGRTGEIVIVERGGTILGNLPEWMRRYAGENLRRMGIRCVFGCSVEGMDGSRARLSSGEEFADCLVAWTAGVRTPAFVRGMGAEKTPQGRLRVDRFLQAAPGVFAAGDCASVRRGEGELRMSVQFALSGGTAAARNALLRLAGRPMEEYRPADPGYVIPLANGRACGRVLGMNARGRLPILLHMAMGVYRTPDARQAFRLLAALARPAKR